MNSFNFIRSSVAGVMAYWGFALGTALGQGSPEGAWDLVMAGRQRGVAQMNFNGDGSIDGIAVFTINGKSLSVTNGGFVYNNIFGSANVQGGWAFERTNRIVGYLNLIGQDGTNMVTNGVSFRGAVRSSKLNLLAVGASGKMNLRGVPLSPTNVVELEGIDYVGKARIPGIPFPLVEIFAVSNDSPNVYDIAGGGPGYTYTGALLVSKQRFAALYQERTSGSAGSAVAVHAGPFNVNKRRGTLKGTDGVNPIIRYRFEPEIP